MDHKQTLIDLLGAYDNLDEPMPLWNHRSVMLGISISFITASWVCVILRLYTRVFVLRAAGWDDALVVVFELLGTAGATATCLSSFEGFGQHVMELPLSQTAKCIQLFWIANATYALETAVIKISLLLQYLRIFERGALRTWCIVLIYTIAVWGTIYSVLAWVPCWPIEAYWRWTLNLTGAKCWGFSSMDPDTFDATYSSHNATNMVFDTLVLLIPIPLYFDKSTSLQSRRGLYGLLGMGALVWTVAIWRLATVVEHKSTTYPTFDPTWYGPASLLLGVVEVNLASICACVPIFWPVLSARVERIFVTQEIKITRAQRYSLDGDDQIELAQSENGSSHSRSGSITKLQQSTSSIPPDTTKHYMDEYVREQVDPLRETGTVQSEISCPKRKDSRKHIRF